MRNLAAAHNQSASAIHKISRRYKVSVAKNSSFIYPGDDALLTKISAGVAQHFRDDYFMRKVIKSCDFIGLNYYFSDRFYGNRIHNPDKKVSDLGWDMSPANLEYAIERLYKKYNKPIIITENGLADAEDIDRSWWLSETFGAMQRAIEEGVDLRGYFHWSLIDNFEWDKGKWPRFGLVEIDYSTKKRKIRKSAKRLASVIKTLQKEST